MTPRETFLDLDNDLKRWEYLIQLDKSLFKILLDNDETYVVFFETERIIIRDEYEDWTEYKWDSFDNDIGNRYGTVALLAALGMWVEGV